jgi:hypothetical protein
MAPESSAGRLQVSRAFTAFGLGGSAKMAARGAAVVIATIAMASGAAVPRAPGLPPLLLRVLLLGVSNRKRAPHLSKATLIVTVSQVGAAALGLPTDFAGLVATALAALLPAGMDVALDLVVPDGATAWEEDCRAMAARDTKATKQPVRGVPGAALEAVKQHLQRSQSDGLASTSGAAAGAGAGAGAMPPPPPQQEQQQEQQQQQQQQQCVDMTLLLDDDMSSGATFAASTGLLVQMAGGAQVPRLGWACSAMSAAALTVFPEALGPALEPAEAGAPGAARLATVAAQLRFVPDATSPNQVVGSQMLQRLRGRDGAPAPTSGAAGAGGSAPEGDDDVAASPAGAAARGSVASAAGAAAESVDRSSTSRPCSRPPRALPLHPPALQQPKPGRGRQRSWRRRQQQ